VNIGLRDTAAVAAVGQEARHEQGGIAQATHSIHSLGARHRERLAEQLDEGCAHLLYPVGYCVPCEQVHQIVLGGALGPDFEAPQCLGHMVPKEVSNVGAAFDT
jgi:hypothetical protein